MSLEGTRMIRAPSKGGEQEALCLDISMLEGWLFGIEVSRVKESLQDKLYDYQRECFSVLHVCLAVLLQILCFYASG